MATKASARGLHPAMMLALVLLSGVTSGVSCAEPVVSGTGRAPAEIPAGRDVAADAATATDPGTFKPLWLPQTRSDWDEIVAAARVNPAGSANGSVDGLEEVLVTAPEDLLPMPGVYEKMWGGLLTPFWAVLHPTQAWRIFAPIPPK